jgi:hypothetical protein
MTALRYVQFLAQSSSLNIYIKIMRECKIQIEQELKL